MKPAIRRLQWREIWSTRGPRPILTVVPSFLRPVISLALLIGALWFAFSVKLGGRTFAEHIDRIGDTPEAHDLLEGTRSTINPVLQEATDRMLGEHIEAPTRAEPEAQMPTEPGAAGATHAATASGQPRASTAERVKLPGQG